MQMLRVVLREDVPLGELASILSCTSELYRILSLAYDEQAAVVNPAHNMRNRHPWNEIEDLHVIALSSGSILVDLATKLISPKVLGKLVDWLRTAADPHRPEKDDLEIQGLKLKLISRQLEVDSQRIELDEREVALTTEKYLANIDVARASVVLVNDALEMYDGLLSRNFPEPMAKHAFYAAVRCLGELRQIQERSNAIITIEHLEM